ncbi:MAG: PaaI family thioesterase [Tannerellaceae bacterium]|nr:PaaI family thioesterase [Tannerellaceae bacterium]
MKKIINPWQGLEGYMCFACSPANPSGLHMEFYEDGDDIVAIWRPDAHYQGWLDTLHGGIQSTLMDEIGGWVVVRKLQTTGVTSRLDARFLKSVSTNEPELTIRGRIKEQKRNAVFIESEIYNTAGEVCARADMVYFVTTPEQAREKFHFNGCHIEEEMNK